MKDKFANEMDKFDNEDNDNDKNNEIDIISRKV